jgi:hypothetical protein
MPIIRCAALTCIHNHLGECGVSDITIIDVNSEGVCIDYSPVTDDEFKNITGRERHNIDTKKATD